MKALTADLSLFPPELKSRRIWCIWRLEAREGRQTKVPYQPIPDGDNYTAQLAKSNDPATWVSLEEATAAVNGSDGWGLGLFCDGSFTFIDLDHCRDPLTGELTPWAAAIVKRVDSYCELSPSETGLHIFTLGAVPAAIKKSNVEMYSRGRFATVTGKHHSGELRAFDVAGLRADVETGKVGASLIVKASNASLADLEGGVNEGDGSGSAGDWAFVKELVRQGLSDEQIDERFRQSQRMREKWERNDYRERTINRARVSLAEEAAQKANATPVDPNDWRPLFHSYEEFCSAPPVTFAIEGFLQEDGITMIGGLPSHGKTWIMLSMVKALLTDKPLFGYSKFSVSKPSQRVVYLCPEVGLGPLTSRLKKFGLAEFVKNGHLLYQTLSIKESATLTDPRMLKAIQGADVFLDTAVRFMEGEENSASEQKVFAKTLFSLLNAGARTVTGAHHAPKHFADASYMTLENALRGTSELGAMLSTAWGVKKVDEATNRVFVENIKPRDFEPCKPFMLEGRPHIDATGDFVMVAKPGEAGKLADHQKKRGRPASVRYEDVAVLKKGKMSNREIAEQLGVSKDTVGRTLRRGPQAAGQPINDEELDLA